MFNITDKELLIEAILKEVGDVYLDASSGSEVSRAIMNEIKYKIEGAIDRQIEKTVRAIINRLYTHEEFERDIGLSRV